MSNPLNRLNFRSTGTQSVIATLLVFGGLALNYIAEGQVFDNWPDLFLPTGAFFLFVAGLIIFVNTWLRARGHITSSPKFAVILAISLFLSVLHFSYGAMLQFIQSGADRDGQCEGLTRAVTTSNDIPESPINAAWPALGCAYELHGMLLSPYYLIRIYGVASDNAQQRILKNLSAYHENVRTHALRIEFYEKDYWVYRKEGGRTTRQRGPGKLLKVAVLR